MKGFKRNLSRRSLLAGGASLAVYPVSACSSEPAEPDGTSPTATDFSRSFCHYKGGREDRIWVRIQIECRCQVFDRSTDQVDEYLLTVRTQTGLRTEPPSDVLDPGYDFWMIFSKRHVFIRRVHTSSYNRNPSRASVDRFRSPGWRLQPSPATRLDSGRELREALQGWKAVVAQSEFESRDGTRGYRIEYPVKWADGNPDNTFRVETGPVVLLDPERVKIGQSPAFDDFQWAYLDYRSFDQVRCFVERPTSILSGSTYSPPEHVPRRNPPLTAEQVARIEGRLFSRWEPPIGMDRLRELLQTDHYSAIQHLPVKTTMYALDQPGAESAV